MNNRSYALDALRGYAIITMVLSGSIAFGILPGWMYHAQTPPPSNIFDPTMPGITWVDLVFPFFLFAMGAAFPFSVGNRLKKGYSKWMLLWDVTKRAVQLIFFAVFIQHFYPWILSNPQDLRGWLLSISCFLLLFPMFMQMPFRAPIWVYSAIKVAAFGIAFILLTNVKYAGDRVFNPNFSNIIILVLANMAFFGTIIYVFTQNNKLVRLAILPCIMAVFLGKDADGSIAKAIYNFTPLAWAYKFVFLKYLFIIIPGSIAGEYIYEWMQINKERDENASSKKDKRWAVLLLCFSIAIIVINIVCLYNRWLVCNLLINIVLFICAYFFTKQADSHHQILWRKLILAAGYLVLLGLLFESYEGGIKKDPSTFSYYFVTAGLGFLGLLFFHVLCDFFRCTKYTTFITMSGQNPMIAYVTTNLLTIPILSIIGAYQNFSFFKTTVWLGFFQGVLLTSIAVLVTMFFTKIKWFWKT